MKVKEFDHTIELETAVKEAFNHLCSTYEIARRGGQDTNWEAFEKKTLSTILDLAKALKLELKPKNDQ